MIGGAARRHVVASGNCPAEMRRVNVFGLGWSQRQLPQALFRFVHLIKALLVEHAACFLPATRTGQGRAVLLHCLRLLISVAGNHFTAGSGYQTSPDIQVDLVGDKLNRAIGANCVHSPRVIAT